MMSLFAADIEFALWNMLYMALTLEMSQLSGWLNAYAYRNM
jgi:hypothetical protein